MGESPRVEGSVPLGDHVQVDRMAIQFRAVDDDFANSGIGNGVQRENRLSLV